MAELHPARITDAEAAWKFLLGGKARFTLVSGKTGTRYTFKVTATDDKQAHFVSTLFGPDNGADYAYLGLIKGDSFRVTGKSRFKDTSPQALAFAWVFGKLAIALPGEQLPDIVEFWHEGSCCRCGRALTVPSSIAAGIGPECATKA